MKIKELEYKLTKMEEDNERLRIKNMKLQIRGGSVPQLPDENMDASHFHMDHHSSPHPLMYGYVETSRATKYIRMKDGG